MSLIKIKDDETLAKDTKSKAVLSVDKTGLERYKAQRDAQRDIRDRQDALEGEIGEIKSLLGLIIAKMEISGR